MENVIEFGDFQEVTDFLGAKIRGSQETLDGSQYVHTPTI
jgi:hypothetical protein